MKTQIKNTIKVAFLMLVIVAIFSCSKKDDDNNQVAGGESTMTWTALGANQVAARFLCIKEADEGFVITGYTADESYVQLNLS